MGHILFVAVLLAAPACEKQGGGKSAAPEEVPVQLALSVGGREATKGDASVIRELRETPSFSGMTDMHFYPFATGETIEAEDVPIHCVIPSRSIGSNDLLSTSGAHLFAGETLLSLPRGTASLLVYGKIRPGGNNPGSVAYKHLNGSLVEQGFTTEPATASALSFMPDAMLPAGGTPEAATAITQILNGVALGDPFSLTAHYGEGLTQTLSFPWDQNIGDENLRQCYRDITAAGALLPGSGTNVGAMLTNLFRSLNRDIINATPYEIEKDGTVYTDVTKDDNTPLTYGDIYRGVRDGVLARFYALRDTQQIVISDQEPYTITFFADELNRYPEELGLPSGAAVVRWTSSGYVVPLENGLDGIAPISAYCYPPPLYYFANSTIRTSDDVSSVRAAYVEENSWNSILNVYADGNRVQSHTRAVAMEDPMQFAVGMLHATVKASADRLLDNNMSPVEVSGQNFPLTGVIIGRQYPLNYDFTPRYVSDNESKQYYLYDDRMPEGIYLHKPATGETLIPFRTLAMQTPPDKETYFCLEFRNDSGDAFTGAEGRILPGHKFYLVGKLDFPSDAFDKVFIQDHVTTANIEVTTLKNAHNAVPDMGIPQLTIGVEIVVDWNLFSTTVMME